MNCINDVDIQKYIDKELTSEELHRIEAHLQNCKSCSQKVTNQRELAVLLRRAIKDIGPPTVQVPKFIPPNTSSFAKRKRNPFVLYTMVAASLLLFGLFILRNNLQTEQEEVTFLHYSDDLFDANQPITEQATLIEVVDPEGNVSKFAF